MSDLNGHPPAQDVAGNRREPIAFPSYLEQRLGRGSAWQQGWRVLVRPFYAGSVTEFWRLWNPVWSWCLHEWVYAPVSRVVPRPLAVMVTFTASGLVHNV